MADPSRKRDRVTTLALVAGTGALAGWWWQSRTTELPVEERTRARLRPWSMR